MILLSTDRWQFSYCVKVVCLELFGSFVYWNMSLYLILNLILLFYF